MIKPNYGRLIQHLFATFVAVLPSLSLGSSADQISITQARIEHEAGRAILIDIRESSEHQTGVAKNAVLLPMSQLLQKQSIIPKSSDTPILLICNTQNRSKVSLAKLKNLGYQNIKFVEKFRKTFVENLEQMPKKLKIHKESVKPILIVGKDCKRENIWRNEIFPQYKANRANGPEDGFMGGPFFKMAYEEQLFIKGGAKAILSHPKLEADDCIALSVKNLVNRYPQCHIYIITSDRDYLQLNAHNVDLYNLTYKNIAESKKEMQNKMIKISIFFSNKINEIHKS